MEGTGLGTRSGCIVGKILGVCQSGGALWLPPLPQGWLPLSLPRSAPPCPGPQTPGQEVAGMGRHAQLVFTNQVPTLSPCAHGPMVPSS